MKKKIVMIVAVLATILVSGGSVLAANDYIQGFFNVGLQQNATVVEPLQTVEAAFGHENKAQFYPGDYVGNGFIVIKNNGTLTYGIRPYVNFNSTSTIVPSPWFDVTMTISQKGGSESIRNGIVNIRPGETLRIDVVVTVGFYSSPGSVTNMKLVFDRVEPFLTGSGKG
ncbi:hypothetical protein ACFLYY_01820 [Patescibacteria group bacterium]